MGHHILNIFCFALATAISCEGRYYGYPYEGTYGSSPEMSMACSLGLKNRLNKHVTLSSSMTSNVRSKADYGRLDQQPSTISSGSWCGDPKEGQYLEAKFESAKMVAGIVTQGNPSCDSWVTKYKVLCGDDEGHYTEYTENGMLKLFNGNSDANSKVFNIFGNVLSCRSIKIVPTSWETKPCLRMEVLHAGCYASADYSFYVKSQGADDGWSCQIMANGVKKSVGGRGICVVIFNPFTAEFKAATFDTFIKPEENTANLVSYLVKEAMEYSVVALAVADTTHIPIDERIIKIAKDYGATGVSCDLSSYQHRDSLAFIGQKVPNTIDRPTWSACRHVRRFNGYAAVHATIKTSKHFVEN